MPNLVSGLFDVRIFFFCRSMLWPVQIDPNSTRAVFCETVMCQAAQPLAIAFRGRSLEIKGSLRRVGQNMCHTLNVSHLRANLLTTVHLCKLQR